MTESVDLIVLSSAFLGFVSYLLVHLCVFRFLPTKQILSELMGVFFIGAAVNISSCAYQLLIKESLAIGLSAVACMLVSFVIYGLMSFIYVLYIFGPDESSIRMRLLRELHKVFPGSMRLEELLKKYNAESILKIRLERFTGSGEVIFDGGKYRIGKKRNIFFLFEDVAKVLQKIVTKK